MTKQIKETKEKPVEKKAPVKSDTKSSCNCGCAVPKKAK